MKNKNILICMIAVSILLLILMITTLINGLKLNTKGSVDIIEDVERGDDKISKADQEIIDKYSPYMENAYTKALTVEKAKKLTEIIDEVVENLNQRNYSALYAKLDAIYVESQFPTEEAFVEFIEVTLLDEKDYVCKFYDAQYHGFECSIASTSQDKSFRLKIVPTETFDDYALTFRTDIVSTEKRSALFGVANLSAEILYEFKCTDTLEFVVSFKNNTNQAITASFEGSDVETNYRGSVISYKLSSPSNEIILKPKEQKNVTLVFDIKAKEVVRPSYMNIICNANKKEYTARVGIDFSDLDTPN